MVHSDWYKNRDVNEVKPLAKTLFEDLVWYFSEANAKENSAALGSDSNRYAWVNAHVDMGRGEHMVYDHVSNYKRGDSFWGMLRKREWDAMSAALQMLWCTRKAEEILHIHSD